MDARERHGRSVRPTTLEEVLESLDRHAWAARYVLSRSPDGTHRRWTAEARLMQTLAILTECGAYPGIRTWRSTKLFESRLQAVRKSLPSGFKLMSVAQARECLAMHGLKVALYEVPYLQRHLVAGLREHEDVVVAPAALGRELNEKALTVSADLPDSTLPYVHAAPSEKGDGP